MTVTLKVLPAIAHVAFQEIAPHFLGTMKCNVLFPYVCFLTLKCPFGCEPHLCRKRRSAPSSAPSQKQANTKGQIISLHVSCVCSPTMRKFWYRGFVAEQNAENGFFVIGSACGMLTIDSLWVSGVPSGTLRATFGQLSLHISSSQCVCVREGYCEVRDSVCEYCVMEWSKLGKI